MIRFVRRYRSSLVKKNAFVRFYHRYTHYYVIISHNTSVPMIGHFESATGTLTSHASWAWLIKILPWSQIFLRCLRSQIFLRCLWADLDLIVNKLKQIGLVVLLIVNATIVSDADHADLVCEVTWPHFSCMCRARRYNVIGDTGHIDPVCWVTWPHFSCMCRTKRDAGCSDLVCCVTWPHFSMPVQV